MTEQTRGRGAPIFGRGLAGLLLWVLAGTALAGPAGLARQGAFTVRQLEWQDRSGGDAAKWDLAAWLGSDRNRLWLRDEGDRVAGDTVENRLELLWGHSLGAWEVLAGLRHDSGVAPSRTYLALGGQALVAGSLQLEATGYVGDGGDGGNAVYAGFRLQADHDQGLGGRFVLASRAEVEIWSEDHARYTRGIGPSQVNVGLRLGYRHRRAEPYVGGEWFRLLGDTGRLAEEAGGKVHEARLVAGLRLGF